MTAEWMFLGKVFDALCNKIYAFFMQLTELCKFLLSIFARKFIFKKKLKIRADFGTLTKFSKNLIF